MLNLQRWQTIAVIAFTALAVLFALPNVLPAVVLDHLPGWYQQSRINLGLDLRGGAHFLLEADLRSVLNERLTNLSDSVRGELRKQQVPFKDITRRAGTRRERRAARRDPARQGDRGDPQRRSVARRVGQRRHHPAGLFRPGPVPPQEGSDRPVDRDPAPPRRRDRHHRAHHRAPGRRPHPAAGAGHQGHHRPQAQDQPDRQAHLPSGQRGRGRGRAGRQRAAHHLHGADARGHAGAPAQQSQGLGGDPGGQPAHEPRADLPALPAAVPAGA